MRVEVDTEASSEKFNRVMGQLPKQVRYASALALTRTAQDAQEQVRRQLPNRFIMRSQWVPKGIRIQRATKANLESTVHGFIKAALSGNGKNVIQIATKP
jgi:hypothetical protein